MRILTLSLAVLTAAACSSAGELGQAPDPKAPTAREMLAENPRFAVSSDRQLVQMVARLDRGDRWVEDKTTLDVTLGEVYVNANDAGDVVLDRLDLYVDDIVAGAGLINDDGLHVSDIHVQLAQASQCHLTEWADDDESCFGLTTATVTFDWSLVVNGEAYELGTQKVPNVALSVGLSKEHGLLGVDITAASDGVFWDWAGIVELADLHVVLHGTQMPLVW